MSSRPPQSFPKESFPKESFPKESRLRRRAEYRRLYDTGRKAMGRSLVVFALPNDLGVDRLGVTATKKVGSAVVRNRLKRRVREIFRRRERVGSGIDLVVNVRERTDDVAFQELTRELDSLIGRARRLRRD